jgi:hypothetical protein
MVKVAGADENPPPPGHLAFEAVVIVTDTEPGVVISPAPIVADASLAVGVTVV